MLKRFQELWPRTKVDVRNDGWSVVVEVTSDSTLELTFAKLLKVALVFDTDKFDISTDTVSEVDVVSEVTWDSYTTYTLKFSVRTSDLGVWSTPQVRALAQTVA